jgi:signal transduction histidine kinase
MGNLFKRDINEEMKLVLHELEQDPFQRFNIAFALMSIIPLLVTFYLLVRRLFGLDVLVGDVGLVLFLTILVSLCGLFVGHEIIWGVLGKVMFYAAENKRINKLKSTFLATASHELKNPLFVLSGNMEAMLEGVWGEINEEQRNQLKICLEASDRMSKLVNDWLDIYKIEAGMVEINRVTVDLVECLEKQLTELDYLRQEKRIKVEKNISNKDLSIFADKDKITEVINNLLNNAIKYTPEEGCISIKILPFKDVVRIEIQNTGRPMLADELEKIFDKFERFEKTEE